MLRRISATPCPVPASTDLASRRDSIYDATVATNFDFTTEFTRANLLTSVKPKRRQTILKKEIVIHEDQPQQDVAGPRLGGSLLARPAKRLRGRVSFAGDQKENVAGDGRNTRPLLGSIAEMEPRISNGSVDLRKGQSPRRRISMARTGILKSEDTVAGVKIDVDRFNEQDRTLAKPPRRGTIYIPPDDTTMPSMYMGIFSPVKEMQVVVEETEASQLKNTGIAAEMAKRRGRRSSLAAEPARRVGPLRPALGTVKEHDFNPSRNVSQDVDVTGAPTGKENLPHGFHQRDFAYDAKCSRDFKPLSTSANYAKPLQRRQTVFGASASGNTRPAPEQRKPAWNSGATTKPHKSDVHISKVIHDSYRETKAPTPPQKVPSRFVLPKLCPEESKTQHFPPIIEDIDNPAMYEDSWLAHQEVAVTQLLNNLFSSASSQEPIDHNLLRYDLLDLYQSPKFVVLHKRLHGAILYGAIRVPENSELHAKRLQSDLGARRSFIDIWTKSYEQVALTAALEVVVGRQCQPTMREIRTFIEVFLIRNEDGFPDADCTDHAGWSYRRTILRSLMLIQLLDQAKIRPHTMLASPLFFTTSPYKSSSEVLQALTQLLNPSMGRRALTHLEYTLEHKQHLLEEYTYPVTNLAIDLRDGVRLTRLVELLLYPSASHQLARDSPDDTAMTLNMPTGEILTTLDIESPTKSTRYPLSQHLKFPCDSRTVKLFNVQIALTALTQVKSMRGIVDNITAEDIVDGFREKTVALLWGLTGKWGLAGLIDWKDVRGEIMRFQRCKRDDEESDFLDEDELDDLARSGFTGYKTLLKAWAGGVASTKGLKVNNLTTSFADGRVFEAIVDEYEAFLPAKESTRLSSSPSSAKKENAKMTLQARLTALGCSAQFSSLFAASPSSATPSNPTQHYQLFTRETTLAALAFLCSRLLSASRRARAGVVVQRAWRAYQLRVTTKKQKMASMLAGQCAEVVRTRERLVRCKRVIWAAWRGYLERKSRVKMEKSEGGRREERLVVDDGNDQMNSASRLDAPGDLWLDL